MVRKLLTGSLIAALLSGTAAADTLRDALVSAYQTNPTLTGQRQSLEATDATVAIAKAAGRPQVSATLGVNRDLTRRGILDVPGSKGPSVSGGVDISYPLFSGGSVKNSVRAAQTRVQAGRATLRAVEGDVFTLAVSSYMDVIRDRSIVELNANNVKVLETNLEATRDRFQIGDLTRTDVAQSEARLQLGRAQLAQAQGDLAGSEATYRQVIGHAPGQLAPPPPLPPLPATSDEAVRIALANNPDLIATTNSARAAGYDVRVAEASKLPTVSAVGSGTYINELGGVPGPNTGSQTTIGVSARIPIFQGGLPAARTRQAQALEGQALEQVVGTERSVVQATRSAFADYDAAQKTIQASSVAVQANELSLEGNRAEQSVGTRTVLDVLNAEQELLQSQVALVRAKRDAYVDGFQLLNAMGQAEAQDLGLDGGPLYDPLGNYRRVADNWNDWAMDPRHDPVATRTVSPQELPPNPVVGPPLVNARVAEPAPPPGVTQPPQ
ncbi:MAG TPA: TolC family outer membrane protein [Sphingomicrobium sp.]|nr:TolC family outer membrane protein [Sphingomicrobium sp.]